MSVSLYFVGGFRSVDTVVNNNGEHVVTRRHTRLLQDNKRCAEVALQLFSKRSRIGEPPLLEMFCVRRKGSDRVERILCGDSREDACTRNNYTPKSSEVVAEFP